MPNPRAGRQMRYIPAKIQHRDDGGEPVIACYFAVFNSPTELWPGCIEQIAPGAFSSSLGGDVRALVDHETRLVLGRTTAGTLTLREDESGLYGEIKINPNDSDAMNLYARVQRGDVSQCSFGFEIVAYIDFEFNGKTYALSFTAEALFTIYDKFGYTADILGTTHVLEPTLEGWKNCCWLAALMASQGELQRRHRGESPQQMLTLEELRTGFMAADSVLLRQVVRDALEQGFHRDIPKPDEDEEVNLVLLEREEAEKKARAAALRASISWLRRLFGSTSAPKKP